MPPRLCCPVGPAQSTHTPAFDFLHVAQHHCLGSMLVFQSFFQEVVTRSRRPSFVLIQEPPLVGQVILLFGVFACFHPPLVLGRPRVATDVNSMVARGLLVFSVPASSPLFMEVTLSSPSNICTVSQKMLRILNVYNPHGPRPPQHCGWHPNTCFPSARLRGW